MSKSDYLENAILNHTLRNTPYTPPVVVYVGLFISTPADSAPGTEVTGNGYARQPVTFGAPSGGSCSNSAEVTFPSGSPGGFGTVVAVGLFDAVSGGNFLRHASVVSPKTFAAGDAPKFLIGQIVVSED